VALRVTRGSTPLPAGQVFWRELPADLDRVLSSFDRSLSWVGDLATCAVQATSPLPRLGGGAGSRREILTWPLQAGPDTVPVNQIHRGDPKTAKAAVYLALPFRGVSASPCWSSPGKTVYGRHHESS